MMSMKSSSWCTDCDVKIVLLCFQSGHPDMERLLIHGKSRRYLMGLGNQIAGPVSRLCGQIVNSCT